MNDKPAGWYYVGDGKLRYRDDYGWTDFYMDTTDPRTMDWPPPTPLLIPQLQDEQGQRAEPIARRSALHWPRRRRESPSPS